MITWTNIIPIFISIISLILASIALYNAHFKRARLKIYSAETIAVWHDKNGIFSVDIPININNEGTKAGIVQSMSVVIKNLQNEEAFLLKWNWFLKFDALNHKWDVDGFPFPIAINGKGSVFKCVCFWGGNETKNWTPSPGTFDIFILGWSKPDFSPDINEYFKISIDRDTSDKIKANLSQLNMKNTYIFRQDWGKWSSKRLSIVELERLIKLAKQ
jgi:hypothetical protein